MTDEVSSPSAATNGAQDDVPGTETKICPECAEEVKAAARVCRFCGHRFAPPREPRRLRLRRERSGRGFLRRHWRKLAVAIALALALAGIGVVVALNWEPEPVFEDVEAPGFDPSLAAGGASSSKLGAEVVLASLADKDAIGYEILSDAVDEEVIDSFAETPASGKWEARYKINNGEHVLLFDAENDRFSLRTSMLGSKEAADELFAVARRYGYYRPEVNAEAKELAQRMDALLESFNDRQFVLGESEPDLAAEAADLASDWQSWLDRYGDYPPEIRLINVRLQVLEEMERVASSGTRGFGRYNRLLDRLTEAIDDYARETRG